MSALAKHHPTLLFFQRTLKILLQFLSLFVGMIFYWGRAHQCLDTAFLMAASTLLSSSHFLLAHTEEKPDHVPHVLGMLGEAPTEPAVSGFLATLWPLLRPWPVLSDGGQDSSLQSLLHVYPCASSRQSKFWVG